MGLTPQHKVDASIEYVSRRDSSFDLDRFEREVDEMQMNGENTDDHCIVRYYAGYTRYDMSVGNVREYFDQDKGPITFSIKRLNRRQYTEIMNTIEQGKKASAQELAFQFGVREISGEDALKLEGVYTKNKHLTEGDLDRIENAFGRKIFYEVGEAVISASGDLTELEKKASGS